MAIDDELEKALVGFSQGSQLDVGREVIDAAIAVIPLAGGAIASLLAGRYRRIIQERAVEVFKVMKEHLEEVDEAKVSREFFESEEFQVLLGLALEQLQTTKDNEKLRMIGCGLANSGVVEFSSETRKELFLRILRDLSPNHITVLKRLLPKPGRAQAIPSLWPSFPHPRGEDLAILQNLAANGLVQEFLRGTQDTFGPHFGSELRSETGLRRAINSYVREILERQFRITEFGIDFLNYFGNSGGARTTAP